MTLREARNRCRLTQAQAAAALGVSLRSYKAYETSPEKTETLKYRYLTQQLEGLCRIDETHGVLTPDEIRAACARVLAEYPITYCYLFGSYAKGKASPTSDIDLLISSGVTGLQFFGLAEKLRERLHKRVDLLDIKQLTGNEELLNEVLKDGIRIYG